MDNTPKSKHLDIINRQNNSLIFSISSDENKCVSIDYDGVLDKYNCIPGRYNTIRSVIELASLFHEKYDGSAPFHKHIKYFVEKNSVNENGEMILTHSSIATGWAKLAKESKISTSVKAMVALRAAHNKAKRDGCPYKKHFNVAEINRYLKHPSDSLIVEADGNINFDALKDVLSRNCESDDKNEIMYIRKSHIMTFLPIWDQRDQHLDQSLGSFAPSSKKFAKGEWSTFFSTYATDWKRTPNGKIEPVVDVITFLQLYYEGDILNDRVDRGELPVQKNVL